MRTLAMKALRYALPALGCLCLMLTSGCLLALIPEKYFTLEAPLGVRHDAQTNVVERLVMKKWFVVHASLIAEPSVSKCYATHVYLERTNQSSIKYKSVESLVGRDPYGQKWLSEDWHFRPIILTTNLWLAVNGPCQFYGRHWITNVWEKDIDFTVYTFGPKSILSQKHLRTFAPRGRRGFPELVFDSQNQHLTYNTKLGCETYNLLEGTISPCKELPKGAALVPRDFGFKDTSEVTMFVGTNGFVKVEGPLDEYSRSTNSFLFSVYVFFSSKPVQQQVVTTRAFADLSCLHLDESNCIITYKSGNDDFIYRVLENSLKRRDEAK